MQRNVNVKDPLLVYPAKKMYYLFNITDFQAHFENQTETANN